MPPRSLVVAGLCVLIALLTASPAPAQLRAVVVADGFTQPLAFVQDPADRTVQYVVEQGGRIRVLVDGVLRATDFLDLSGAIVSGGEQGLLGLAFSPDYATSGRFFVDFTNRSGDTVVARFKRSAADRLVADPASRLDFLWSTGERVIRQPFANHNGGNLAFGPDGYLYVGMGDGGSANDPGNRAQDGKTLLGKILRLDGGVADGDQKGFRIPPDNPFLDGQPVAALPEIWSFGWRNPWRFTFDDPALGGTGALVAGDVGQNAHEEIDYEPRGRGGRNYGWRIREGAHPNVGTLPPAFTPLTEPIFDYDHDTGFSIIGGDVYRGSALGLDFYGRYFYADLNGRVWSLGLAIDAATGEAMATNQIEHTGELGGAAALGAITSFGVDAVGELYIVSFSGRIVRLTADDRDHDGLPDPWEQQFGLNPDVPTGNDGPDGDPDGDGRTNLEEYRAGTHPRGFFRRVFGGGLAGGTVTAAAVVLVNQDQARLARVLLRYQRTDRTLAFRYLSLAPGARENVPMLEAVTGQNAQFLAGVESDIPLVLQAAPGR